MVYKKILAALAIGMCFSFPSFASDGSGENAVLQTPFLAAVKEGNKWGAVDGSGHVVIPVSYNRIGISLVETADRSDDLTSDPERLQLIEVEEGKERGFYNREGKVIVPVSYTSRSLWQEGALAVRNKEKKILFYRNDGTMVSETAYDEASDFQNHMAIIEKKGKYGYLSSDGKVIAPVYEDARFFDEEGMAPVKEKGRWGVIDREGRQVIAPQYKATGPSYGEGLLAVKDNKNKWGFIDRKGNEVVPFVYRNVSPRFIDGYGAVENDEKLWGFVDTKGNVTAAPQFKKVLTPFSEGLAGVSTVDGYGYVRPDGTLAFLADFDKLYPFEDGIAEVRKGVIVDNWATARPPFSIGISWGIWHHHHHDPWGWGIGFPVWNSWDYESVPTIQVKRGYIDRNGKTIASTSNDRVFPADKDGILIRNDGRYGWVNRKGEFIAHITYRGLIPIREDHVLLAQNKDKKWGILSAEDGSTLVPFTFDALSCIHKGIYGYKKEGQWGLLSREGRIITEPLYREVGEGTSGFIPVRTSSGWKYVDDEGKDRITFSEEVSEATPFRNGRAGVRIGGKWGIIDTTGHFIFPPRYDDIQIM